MIKFSLPFLCLIMIAGCATSTASDAPSPTKQTAKSVKVKQQKNKHGETIIVKAPAQTIKIKCSLPRQPSPLDRPVPVESLKTLVDRLTLKLQEWVSYGDKVEKAC